MINQIQELQQIAGDLRCQVVRMLHKAGSGHPGGALSAADIIAALYFSVLRVDPNRPDWPERDRFVLSKGHSCPVLYAALARRGFFPEEALWTLRQVDSILQGHPDMLKTPGVEATTGSLGQGFSVACGMAWAAKLDKESLQVYVMLGCGELQEGQVWEAAMSAAHYKLDNLIAIVDYNQLQLDGTNADIMMMEPVVDKWRAFGWAVLEIDGHNMSEILGALAKTQTIREQPAVIIAHTIKGKGVSFMENQVSWHAGGPTAEQLEQALDDLCYIKEAA